ncbi:MAG TPA: OmpH family outer membrane protein, partial [Ferruginibacter sp.]|nr:OmpH family outer membrane protein [Ferruginibacter sp.]
YGKFVKDSAKLSPAVREAKRGDLQTRIADLQNKEQQFNKMLEDAKEKQLKPVRDKMVKAIQDVAKENGYAHVLYKEYALVFPEADDLADKVKKKLGVK